MNPLRPQSAAWQRVCDWYKIRDGYWFAPKLYGIGATPVRWQGWALFALFLAAALGVVWLGKHYGPGMLTLLIPVIAAFTLAAHAKTDGVWKWRWGPDR